VKTRLACAVAFILLLSFPLVVSAQRAGGDQASADEPTIVSTPTSPPGSHVAVVRPLRAEEPTTTTTAPTTTTTKYVPPTTKYTPPTTVRVAPATTRVTTTVAVEEPVDSSGDDVLQTPYMRCVATRESRNSHSALNASSGAGGKWQLMPSTARVVAGWMGRPNLASTPPHLWAPVDQDQGARVLYAHMGKSPWYGPGCS